jgi:hypothetical protein
MWIFPLSEDIWAGSLNFSECIYDHEEAIVKRMATDENEGDFTA